MRIATWNIKQMAPRKPLPQRMSWLSSHVNPDVVVLTEADVKTPEALPNWNTIGRRQGLTKTQHFTTYVSANSVVLRQFTSVKRGFRSRHLDEWYPGTLVAADINVSGHRWGTIVGLYATIRDPDGHDHGNGFHSLDHLLDDVDAIIHSRRDRVIVAGDLNLWPADVNYLIPKMGLTDLIEYTRDQRDPLLNCSGCEQGDQCGHLWTHKNGNQYGNGKPQQIDYIFSTNDMLPSLTKVWGGTQSFEDVLDYSDHAPVVADFAD